MDRGEQMAAPARHRRDEPASRGLDSRTIGERHVSLHAQVVTQLRQRIIQGEYSPGERLIEETLAEEFGVSRNPVREAIRVVEAEGFVHVLARRGAVVVSPDVDTVEDLFAVRSVVEPLSARLAADRATDEQIGSLREILADSQRATEANDYPTLAVLNSQFHVGVIEASGNRWLSSMTTSLYHHVQWVFRMGAHDRAPHSWVEHVELADALTARNPEWAERAARQHVDAAHDAARDLPYT